VYNTRILDAAIRELAGLDKIVKQRIVERIRWLAINLEQIKPEALSGKLTGLYKLRAGDYRIIYEIIPNEQIVLIHAIWHRREIYRKH
jgi:mRNA interferase RelE/StbE